MASSLKERYFSEPKEFRDPVHGDMRLYKYELYIINTRAFQRLRGVKQLAACELVWSGATHTRFQHSLGTLAMAERICESLRKREYLIQPAQHIVARLLALLHDVGHVPFGHTVEDERPVIQEKHDDESRVRRIIAGDIELALSKIEELFSDRDKDLVGISTESKKKKAGSWPKNLTDLLVLLITSGKGETEDDSKEPQVNVKFRLFLDLISNTVCADLFDYLSRDTYYTGLRRAYDEKILSHLVIWKSRLAVDLGQPRRASEETEATVRTRGGIVTEISNLLRVRYTLAERVYFNDTKACASAMISQAVQIAGLKPEALSEMRDDQLLCYLETVDKCPVSIPKTPEQKKLSVPSSEDSKVFLDVIRRQETLDLWTYIASSWEPTVQDTEDGAKEILNAYKRRNIFRPVYRLRTEDVTSNARTLLCRYLHKVKYAAFRRLLERWLAEMCGVPLWQVIIYCPTPQMNVKVAKTHVGPLPGGMYKEMDKLTTEDVNGNDALKVLKNEAIEIQDMHSVLWSMEVLVDNEAAEEAKRYISACSVALFGYENALVPDIGSGITIEDARRTNLIASCQQVGIQHTVSIEQQLLHARDRRGNLYTTAEFTKQLATPQKSEKGLFPNEHRSKPGSNCQ